MEVRNDDFAKHLRKIFKKKLRIAKVKSDDEDNDGNMITIHNTFTIRFIIIS